MGKTICTFLYYFLISFITSFWLPGRLAFGISVEIGKLSCGARPQLMSKIDCNF